MSDNFIFFSCSDSGVSRAERDQRGEWQIQKNLQGLDVACLVADPSNESMIYAGTRSEGVWHSTDMGRNWQALGLHGQIVKSLAVNPHDSEVLYAGSKPALIFRSVDGGSSWEELQGFREIPNRWWWFSPADPPDRRPYVISIAASPSKRDVLLAGVEFGGVMRSEDGGLNWSRHLRGSLRDCHSLLFHQTDGNWVYEAGGSGGGASLSKDGGVTWKKQKQGLAANYGIVCAADPAKPEVWYICVGKSPFNAFGNNPQVYLYRSSGGADWEPIGWEDHPLTETPTTLVTIPGRTGELYAGLKNGDVWHSTDYGESWEKMPFNFQDGIWHTLLVLDAGQVMINNATEDI